MIKKINVNIPIHKTASYPILIGTHLLKKITWIPKNYSQIVIITDSKVKKYFADSFIKLLKIKNHKVLLLSFPSGEKSKSIHTKNKLEEKMLKGMCDRNTLIVALGGGVVGDLSGFIAATYMRGIDYIQIPTTLLAMVDSSIGGKTGIDTPQGKNLIGAFWQPKAVISDIACLHTLPKKHLINGLIEALKVFLIQDTKSFNYFKNNIDGILQGDSAKLMYIVEKAAQIKIDVVQKDEKDNNLRAILNFGHTIGHALELITNYKLLHGHAVGYGILIEAKMAELMGLLSSKHYFIIESILDKLTISRQDIRKWDINKIIEATRLDKKAKKGKIHYILLKDIGAVYQHKKNYAHIVSDEMVKKAYFAIAGATIYGR